MWTRRAKLFEIKNLLMFLSRAECAVVPYFVFRSLWLPFKFLTVKGMSWKEKGWPVLASILCAKTTEEQRNHNIRTEK